MSILSEETHLESEKLFKKNYQSRSCELDSMSQLSGLVYIKSHVTKHVSSIQFLSLYTVDVIK